MEVGKDAPGPRKGQVGLNHMAWMVESLGALEQAYQRLQDNDVEIDVIIDHGISLGIYFRDPDGNGVELSSGAVRNHKPDVMYKAFEIAGYSREEVDERFRQCFS